MAERLWKQEKKNMNTDDILVDTETAFVKKGKTYLFSDSYLALKHYDIKLSNIENNKKNKKFGYVYKGQLHSKLKHGDHPFVCITESLETIENTTFLCRI